MTESAGITRPTCPGSGRVVDNNAHDVDPVDVRPCPFCGDLKPVLDGRTRKHPIAFARLNLIRGRRPSA